MTSYNAYYNMYPAQEPVFDAYIPQKHAQQHVAIDASLACNQDYHWNQANNVPGVMEHQEFYLVHPQQMVAHTDLWQPQLDYSSASNAQQFENWDPVYNQAQSAYPYQQEQYTHVDPMENALYQQAQMMSPPMAISPSYSSYTNQYPQSWASNLSTTPPNEYHSSGSDGGSDDIHAHVPLTYPRTGPPPQWPPAPTPMVMEPEDEPEPEQPSQSGKKSYYKPRHLKNISNNTRSLVRADGTRPPPSPAANGAAPYARMPAASMISKKKPACGSCKKRKISCAPPTVGVKCNQCQRTGLECDLS